MKPIKRFNLTPARGQAVLNFQGRLFPTKLSLYEHQKVEQIGATDSPNQLLQGDCLSACAYLKAQNTQVDLVYIDPPFASGANYAKKIYLRNGGRDKTALEASTSIGEEVMYGDIWQKEDYLNWLYERLLAIREVMSETASIYVHLDWHIGHYAKVLLDEVFGEENFINEIIWAYRSGGASKKGSIARKHDTILFYCKAREHFSVNKITERQYLEKPFMGSKEDDQGRDYVDTILTDTLSGVIHRVVSDDSIKEYNIRPVLNLSQERLEYNTQKPEGLIELLLEIASDKNMIVADFFVGSGTTAAVAHKLGRKFIACDVGINAIQTTRDRLVEAKANFAVYRIQDGLRLRNPQQTEAKIFQILDGFQPAAELELGSFWDGGLVSFGGAYAPLKFVGMEVLLTEKLLDSILEEIYKLEDAGIGEPSKSGGEGVLILYARCTEGVTQDYLNNALRTAAKTQMTVRLLSLDQVLAEKRDSLFVADNAEVAMRKVGNQFEVKITRFHSSYLSAKLDEYNNKRTKRGTLEQDLSKLIQLSESGLELIEAVQFDTTTPADPKIWQSNPDLEDKATPKQKIKGVYTLDTNKFRMKIRNIAGDESIIDSADLLKPSA